MGKRSLPILLAAATVSLNAFGATGNLLVYDDTDENGFNHEAAACGDGMAFFGETQVFHSGTAAIAIPKADNDGAGWAVPSTPYSTQSDYDGVSFWINAGNDPTSTTSLAVFDSSNTPQFLHLEDVYGGPLPAATWLHFTIPFSSPYFDIGGSTPPDSVASFCIINHSGGGNTQFLYLDDVSLTGADIFKNGFEN